MTPRVLLAAVPVLWVLALSAGCGMIQGTVTPDPLRPSVSARIGDPATPVGEFKLGLNLPALYQQTLAWFGVGGATDPAHTDGATTDDGSDAPE